MDCRKVHGFVNLALAGGSIAKIREDHGFSAGHSGAQSVADRLSESGSHNVGYLDYLVGKVCALERKLTSAAVRVTGFTHE